MPLSWNEIKSRAFAFSKRWADAGNEESEAKPFLIDFFEVFGITNKRVASFEHAVRKFDGRGRIDLFWPGILLVEMKSRGRDLDRAYTQAMDYFHGISERDLPRHVLVSDFARFRLHNLDDDEVLEFALADLHRHVKDFGFIAGYQTQVIKPQDPINVRAAERMGRLHDQLKAVGYDGSPLEVYLVRLLFCLFAEDTGIFEKRQFQDYIEQRTGADGSDLAHHLASLFHVLNTPQERRLRNLDEALATFPYVNGRLFEAMLPPAGFDRAMRESLLDLCALDWSRISPAVFGSLFQSIMDEKARRNLGAHYTSEENILKLIKPLFLDELWAEFEKIRGNRNRLFDFHKRLRQLHFFDPACGCGNFLVITYRELRTLELEVLRAAYADGQMALDIHQIIQLDVDQFHGIELEEFPAQIAQVALWLTDHQMNLKVSEEFGSYFARIPLKQAANIVHGNALRMDWSDVLPAERCSYVLGNPPFIGAKFMDDAHNATMPGRCSPASTTPVCSTTSPAGMCWPRTMARPTPPCAAPLCPPTASVRANRLAPYGAGCWRKAPRFISLIARLRGATRREARQPCTASSSVLGGRGRAKVAVRIRGHQGRGARSAGRQHQPLPGGGPRCGAATTVSAAMCRARDRHRQQTHRWWPLLVHYRGESRVPAA